MDALELEDESSDGGGGVAAAGTQAFSAQRVPLAAGGGRWGGGEAVTAADVTRGNPIVACAHDRVGYPRKW